MRGAIDQYGQERLVVASYSDMVKLYDEILAANGNFDVQNISQNYDHLLIRADIRATVTGSNKIHMRFNGDTGTNYSWRWEQVAGSQVQDGAAGDVRFDLGYATASDQVAGWYSPLEVVINSYRLARTRGWHSRCYMHDTGAVVQLQNCAGLWRNVTDAINRIQIYTGSGTVAAGSRLTLYGIRSLGEAGALLAAGEGEWYGTSLPGDPVDGMIANLVVDATNGIVWRFRRDNSQATYKWVFLGGSPLFALVDTEETTTSTSFAALATAGPSITIPNAGDYMVSHGAGSGNSGAGNRNLMSYDIGGTGAVDADAVRWCAVANDATNSWVNCSREKRKTAFAAGAALTAKYRTFAGTAGFKERWMAVRPIRVS